MNEYIIHGTTCKNLEDILNSKYIEANINNKNKGMLQDNSVNQIFTQLLYRNLPNENSLSTTDFTEIIRKYKNNDATYEDVIKFLPEKLP